MKVSNLYITQVKRKCGIELAENFNIPRSEGAKATTMSEGERRGNYWGTESISDDLKSTT